MRVLRIPKLALLSLTRSRPSFCIRSAGQHNILATSISRLSTGLLSATIAAQQNSNLNKTIFSPSRIMADDKSRKQATLGYVRDGQQTIGCVDTIRWRMRPFILTSLGSCFSFTPLIHTIRLAGGFSAPVPANRRRSKPH